MTDLHCENTLKPSGVPGEDGVHPSDRRERSGEEVPSKTGLQRQQKRRTGSEKRGEEGVPGTGRFSVGWFVTVAAMFAGILVAVFSFSYPGAGSVHAKQIVEVSAVSEGAEFRRAGGTQQFDRGTVSQSLNNRFRRTDESVTVNEGEYHEAGADQERFKRPLPENGPADGWQVPGQIQVSGSSEGGASDGYRIRAVNVASHRAAHQPVKIDMSRLPEKLRGEAVSVKGRNGRKVPGQVEDLDRDGQPDLLVFLADFEPHQRKWFELRPAQEKANARNGTLEVRREEDQIRFSNQYLSCMLNVNTLKLDVGDRRPGKTILNGIDFSRFNRGEVSTRVVAEGPVRIVVEQSYTGHWTSGEPFDVTERRILYASQPSLKFQLTFQNAGDDPQEMNHGFHSIHAWAGDYFMKNSNDVHTISNNNDHHLFTTNRMHKLWYNPAREYAFGIVANSAEAARRMDFKKDNGRVLAGAAKRYNMEKNRFRSWNKFNNKIVLKPGNTRVFSYDYYFYPGTKEEILPNYRNDVYNTVGIANVYGPDREILRIARGREYLRAEFKHAGRWLSTSGANNTHRARQGKMRIETPTPGEGMYTPLVREFHDLTELRGEISELGDNTAVRFTIKDLRSGKTETYRTGQKSFRFDVTKNFHTTDNNTFKKRAPCILRVELVPRGDGSEAGPLYAEFDKLALSWPYPGAPELTSPPEDFAFSRLALTFRITSGTPQTVEKAYALQVAEDPQFNSVVETYTEPMYKRGSFIDRREHFAPDKLLPPGTYHVRARAISVSGEPGPWNDPRTFTVSDEEMSPKEPVRPINHENPLFVVPGKKDYNNFWKAVPDRYKPYFAAEINMRRRGREGIEKRIREWPDDIRMFIRQAHIKTGDLSYLESLFANHEKVLGFYFGEAGHPDRGMKRGLQVAAQHGRYAGVLAGSWPELFIGADREYYDLLDTHGSNLLTIVKSQFPGVTGRRYGHPMGLWLTGRLDFWGGETEWWAAAKTSPEWEGNAGKDALNERMRGIDWMPPFLMSLAGGAALYRTETFIGDREHPGDKPRGWNKKEKRFGPIWTRAVGPFYKDIVRQNLIPSREQVMEKIRVAFAAKPSYAEKTKPGFDGGYPHKIVEAAHGGRPYTRQWVPETNRFFLIPMLPALATDREKARFEQVVHPDEFGSTNEAVRYLRKHYPETGSEAFAHLVGDTGIITNTRDAHGETVETREELWTDEVSEEFFLNLTKGPVRSVNGTVSYREYLILKQKSSGLFVHSNDYREKNTTFTLVSSEELDVRTNPASALVDKTSSERNQGGVETTVTLSHEHDVGVVRLHIE